VRDVASYRGTAGALRDLCCRFHDDDYVLVAHAAQVLKRPLTYLVRGLAQMDPHANVTLWADRSGVPSGLYLVRCGSLNCVPEKGYFDLKEQALPRIAKHHRVMVARHAAEAAMPIRTLPDVIAALRWLHDGHLSGGPLDALDVEAHCPFSVCESGAHVDPSARICDSLVLAGAKVHSGAVVARSIICPGAIVPPNASIVDRVMTPASRPQIASRWIGAVKRRLNDLTTPIPEPQTPELAPGEAVA
jgi:NDP-sugar pyrophosphorylase family protein